VRASSCMSWDGHLTCWVWGRAQTHTVMGFLGKLPLPAINVLHLLKPRLPQYMVRARFWELRFAFATPDDSPRQDCSLYRGLHVRRGSLGCVHRSRTILRRPVPKPP
jgi:hypothetical protein